MCPESVVEQASFLEPKLYCAIRFSPLGCTLLVITVQTVICWMWLQNEWRLENICCHPTKLQLWCCKVTAFDLGTKVEACMFERQKFKAIETEGLSMLYSTISIGLFFCERYKISWNLLLTGEWICFQGGPAGLEVQPSGRDCLVDLCGRLSLLHLEWGHRSTQFNVHMS